MTERFYARNVTLHFEIQTDWNATSVIFEIKITLIIVL